MKNFIISFFRTTIPLLLGLFLVWYIYKDLTPLDKQDIARSFKKADYLWVVLSIFIGILSHVSRAMRWQYLLEPIGFRPHLMNSFFAVMIGYLANMAFPRLGEVLRCGTMAKYENIPFKKLLGTVIVERSTDFLILLAITLLAVTLEMDALKDYLNEIFPRVAARINTVWLLLIIAGGTGVVFVLYKFSSRNPLIVKTKAFMSGVFEGVKTIVTMRRRWAFILHTLFIWTMYFLMFYICIFALEETAMLPPAGALVAFSMGSYGIIAVQGGIGAYPAIITETFSLYQIPRPYGFAFGWLIWTAQSVMILAIGVASLVLMPAYNKKIGAVQRVSA